MEFPGGGPDVFVIGGGPAGLATAIAARRKGFSVIVADGAEPPIDKPCGEGLMPDAVDALREMGIEIPSECSVRFRGIRFIQDEIKVAADFARELGTGVRRIVLHKALIKKAEESGVRFLWKTPISGIERGRVRLNSGLISARWIVAADGGRSRARRWCGLEPANKEELRFAARRHYRARPWTDYMEVYWKAGVQAYVTPTSREKVCVVTMGDTADQSEFENVLNKIPSLRERVKEAVLSGVERGAVTATQSLTQIWRDNVARVGDASGGVDAISGEGLRLAFRQALALAEAMHVGDLRVYGEAHKKLIRRPLRMTRMMIELGRREALRSRIFKGLSCRPELFEKLLAIHAGEVNTRNAISAGVSLSWQLLAG
ncbi:MAG TPA: NAD(P)/FAD-dependent oxidoreductase [Candidatus Acidoferrum sp.]|nr:NAD(P)/FAD-dependent oxidoreductase [Candidatus Acidoferrum sp.]